MLKVFNIFLQYSNDNLSVAMRIVSYYLFYIQLSLPQLVNQLFLIILLLSCVLKNHDNEDVKKVLL